DTEDVVHGDRWTLDQHPAVGLGSHRAQKRIRGGLLADVLYVRARETGGLLGELVQEHVRVRGLERPAAEVEVQELATSRQVRQAQVDLVVEPARAHDGRVAGPR